MHLLAAVTTTIFLLQGHIGFEYVPWWGNLLIALWLWCFGGNVGSFMNVVVYRLPAGVSVVHPGSRCPKCGHPIRWYDNIPVLSWVLLRARCRDCGAPIAGRYPFVEAVVAVAFVVLAFAVPIYLAEQPTLLFNTPQLRSPRMYELWLMYACQLLLLCTLLCEALMRYDGHVPPRRLYLPVVVAGFLARLVWPDLRLVAFHAAFAAPQWCVALLDGLIGAAIGASLGRVVDWFALPRRRNATAAVTIPLALCGLVLGWQAVSAVACLAMAGHGVVSWCGRRWGWLARVPVTTHVVLGSALYIVFLVPIVNHASWLGARATIATYVVAMVTAGLLALLAAPPVSREGARRKQTHDADGLTGAVTVTDRPKPDVQQILDSPSYLPAERDMDFLQRYELRPVRVQLELLKPEMGLAAHDVHSTIVAFGGTQILEENEARLRLEEARSALSQAPEDATCQRAVTRAERILAKSRYYDAAREFARLVSSVCQIQGRCEFVIVTGGGPGVMEAANRGAYEVGAKSIGLNITLPEEQVPNSFITPDLCFQFHYFALRKMHFLLRAKALVVFPGGFGTLDELFDALTLRQTRRMQEIPVILYGREYWERVIDFQFLADEGVIADEHLDLIDFAETPQEAWGIITRFHGVGAS